MKSLKKIVKDLIFTGSFFFLIVPQLLFAQASGTGGSGRARGTGGGSFGGTLTNPLGGTDTFSGLIGLILDAVIVIGLPIAALFIIYAGFLFVTAQGNTEKITKAKLTFLWTIVGVGIFLAARVLSDVIGNTVNFLRG